MPTSLPDHIVVTNKVSAGALQIALPSPADGNLSWIIRRVFVHVINGSAAIYQPDIEILDQSSNVLQVWHMDVLASNFSESDMSGLDFVCPVGSAVTVKLTVALPASSGANMLLDLSLS